MADYTDDNKKPTEKNDREQMKDIIECKNDGKDITKEEDDFYEKMYLEYVKREGGALGFRENFEDDDTDDSKPKKETELKPEKPREIPQEKHNNDSYEFEDEDGNTRYTSETIDYAEFKKSMKKPNHTFKHAVDSVIDDTYSANKRLDENIEDPKFQKKFQKLVSETVGVKFKNGEMDYEDFEDNNSHIPSDQIDGYDNWNQAVHHTFAKHPEKFEGIDGFLDEAIELQKELNEVRKKNFDEADYLWRGMSMSELEQAGDGIQEGQGEDQSWSVDYEVVDEFYRSGEDMDNIRVKVRVPKNTPGMYDINYSVLKEDNDFSKFTTQGIDYLKEDEYRLKNRDMSQIFNGVAMVQDYGMSEEVREKIPGYKVVFKKVD